jgi:uncharacterized protein (TIGR00255 family)
MTGYGRAEVTRQGITAIAELRSVNNRFLEVSARLPRTLAIRENDVKEVLRRTLQRGKINVGVTIERQSGEEVALRVNAAAAKDVRKLLRDLKKSTGLKDRITLDHVLHFSEVIEQKEIPDEDELEWEVAQEALVQAAEQLKAMREQEGRELEKDFRHRLELMEANLAKVEVLSREQVPAEKERLRERIAQLVEKDKFDLGRFEMEVAILADRLDVTEECVRFRSHTKFFRTAISDPEPAGRKLNFLLQEMNREANTIGSKSSSAEIAHIVVSVKEELERVREQVQNIE